MTCDARRLEVFGRVARRDAAADLQATRVRAQSGLRRLLVAGPEHDHVPAVEAVALIHGRKLVRGLRRLALVVGPLPGSSEASRPTICFTRPWWRSMHGLKAAHAFGRPAFMRIGCTPACEMKGR